MPLWAVMVMQAVTVIVHETFLFFSRRSADEKQESRMIRERRYADRIGRVKRSHLGTK
jgi:hypothetical protein